MSIELIAQSMKSCALNLAVDRSDDGQIHFLKQTNSLKSKWYLNQVSIFLKMAMMWDGNDDGENEEEIDICNEAN